MPKFAHELIKEKRAMYESRLARYEANKEVFNLGYDVMEELEFIESTFFYSGNSCEDIYVWMSTYKDANVVEVIEQLFTSIDPICEDAGFELDTNNSKKNKTKYIFKWVKDNYSIKIELDTSSSCTKVKTGQTIVDTFEYVCNG